MRLGKGDSPGELPFAARGAAYRAGLPSGRQAAKNKERHPFCTAIILQIRC